MKRKNLINFIISISVNLLIIFGFLLFYSFKIEISDNITYAQFIAEGDYTFDYMDYFICMIIGLVQKFIYPINAFVIFHYLFSFCSFCAITVVFVDKFHYSIGTLISMIVLSFYSISHYGNLSFTRDAGLFCVAGFLLIVHFHNRKKYVFIATIGGLLVFVGSQYRFLIFLASVLLLTTFVLTDSILMMIENDRNATMIEKAKNSFAPKRILSFLAIFVFCITMHLFSIAINSSTPELAYYREYTYARQAVYDYPIPDYSEFSEEYDKIGFDQNDVDMNRAWYLDDNGAFTLDNLRKLKNLRDNYSSQRKNYGQLLINMITEEFANVRALGDKGVAFIGFVIILLFYLIYMKKKYYIIPFNLCVAIIFLYYYLWSTDRNPPFRAVYVIWLSAYVYLLYSFSEIRMKDFSKKHNYRRITTVFLITNMVVLTTIGLYLSVVSNYGICTYEKNDYSIFWIQTDSRQNRQMLTFNNTYYKYTNIMRHMEEFGTDNMYSNLLNENIYFVCNTTNDESEMMLKYLSKYYSGRKEIKCKKITLLKGYESFMEYLKQHENDKFEISRKNTLDNNEGILIYKFEVSR